MVARDRVSDSERVLCFGGVITVARDSGRLLYSGRLITVARDRDSDSERLIFFRVIFYSLFRPPNFPRPWADFRETLSHDAVCAEIVYLLYGYSYVPPNKFKGQKNTFWRFSDPKSHFEPRHSIIRGKSGNLKQ